MGFYRPFGADDTECEECTSLYFENDGLMKHIKALQLALYHATMGEPLTKADLAVINALPEEGR